MSEKNMNPRLDELMLKYKSMNPYDLAQNPGTMRYGHERGGAPIIHEPVSSFKSLSYKITYNDAYNKLQDLMSIVESTLELIEYYGRVPKVRALEKKVVNLFNKEYDKIVLAEIISETEMRFIPSPTTGECYIYEKKDGHRLMSILAPHEGGSNIYEKYLCTIKANINATFSLIDSSEPIQMLLK